LLRSSDILIPALHHRIALAFDHVEIEAAAGHQVFVIADFADFAAVQWSRPQPKRLPCSGTETPACLDAVLGFGKRGPDARVTNQNPELRHRGHRPIEYSPKRFEGNT
jgi:hypothetical protein